MRFWFLARSAGDLPDFTLTYRILNRPTVATALPTADVALTMDMSGGAGLTADQYLELDSANMTLAPGDEVYFTLTRSASGGDGYDDEVHILFQKAIIKAFS